MPTADPKHSPQHRYLRMLQARNCLRPVTSIFVLYNAKTFFHKHTLCV